MSRGANQRANPAEIEVDIYEYRISIDIKSTKYTRQTDKSEQKSSRTKTITYRVPSSKCSMQETRHCRFAGSRCSNSGNCIDSAVFLTVLSSQLRYSQIASIARLTSMFVTAVITTRNLTLR